ncbi:MAG: Chorismate dehydratase [Verrucomicrobiales bacterium]|nr:Chorismate dehydratase [Verrucomicrobiales bacterium]
MAAAESAEQLARRFEREQRQVLRAAEDKLAAGLGKARVGSVPYLNAVPLTRGLEEDIVFVPPSQLATLLRKGDLDAGLVSITEVFFHDIYDILDGVAIASLGEVKSVFLAHLDPLDKIGEIACDTASLTSVNLLRVLLTERGLSPQFRPLKAYADSSSERNVLLIGDPAIEFIRSNPKHEIWDLGAAWFELTGLPFVYAVWAIRRDRNTRELRQHLREAKNFGLDTLDNIIRTRPEFDLEFRKDYLGWHIHYHLGTDEKRGIARFLELLKKHQPEPVFQPTFTI